MFVGAPPAAELLRAVARPEAQCYGHRAGWQCLLQATRLQSGTWCGPSGPANPVHDGLCLNEAVDSSNFRSYSFFCVIYIVGRHLQASKAAVPKHSRQIMHALQALV